MSGGILPKTLVSISVSSQTPKTENDLYQTYNWSFATGSSVGYLGLPRYLPRYGNIVYEVDQKYWLANSWATANSGSKIYENLRHLPRSRESMGEIPKETLKRSSGRI